MTVHSRRNNRASVVRDIATDYWKEEKEQTQKLLERKKRQQNPNESKTSGSLTTIETEKKKKTPKNFKKPNLRFKRSSNKTRSSTPKAKIRPQGRRTVMKKSREGKTRVKKRNQYSQRYNV